LPPIANTVLGMEIRRADMRDAVEISRLDSAAGFEERVIEKYLCSIDASQVEKTVILLAIEGGKAVGKAEIVIGRRGDTGRLGYLRKVVVDPNFRGKGIAKALAKSAFGVCREESAPTLDLHVTEDNAAAIALYEGLGFRLRHRELHMRKTL